MAFVPTDVIELIRFHCACQVAIGLVGDGSIPEPPAPAITGPAVDAQFSGNTPRRTRETEQKRRQNPVRQRSLALVQQGRGEVVEGALAAMTPVAFASGAVLVRAPASNVVALASRTLQRTVFPPERVDVDLALFGVEELVQMGEHRHG